nr:MAG TPA: hypothetical protein [Caudoviricetes sp.]
MPSTKAAHLCLVHEEILNFYCLSSPNFKFFRCSRNFSL